LQLATMFWSMCHRQTFNVASGKVFASAFRRALSRSVTKTFGVLLGFQTDLNGEINHINFSDTYFGQP
jgi:hypothetical protein